MKVEGLEGRQSPEGWGQLPQSVPSGLQLHKRGQSPEGEGKGLGMREGNGEGWTDGRGGATRPLEQCGLQNRIRILG